MAAVRAIAIDEHTFGIVGYLTGATLALGKAIDLAYVPRRVVGTNLAPLYRRELERAARLVHEGAGLPPSWEAGFHFNSALHRIAACADRITAELDRPPRDEQAKRRRARFRKEPAVEAAYKEVNDLKHRFGGRTPKVGLTLDDALKALRAVANAAAERWGSSG